jgi:hypothetical protein
VIASGSGPPRRPVSSASIAAISSGVSSKSKTSMFSAMRLGLVDFGDDRAPVLDPPAQHGLGGRLAVRLSDAADHGVVEGAGVLAVAVERDPADRRPGLGEDAVLGAARLDLGLDEVGVHLDLVDGGDDAGAVEQRGEVVDHEVADADRADLAVREQRLERPVGLECPVEGARQGLVEDEQVRARLRRVA